MKTKILVVEDDPDVQELVQFNLKESGYDVVLAEAGPEALRKAQTQSPELIILDWMLPEMDGLEVCKLLKRDSATQRIPIIMLTAKAAEIDRVLGLEMGADDYLTKPFSPRELMLRIKKLLARQMPSPAKSEFLKAGDLVVDLPRHEASVKGVPVVLTATEFKLLVLLMERSGRVQSRDQLLQDVWDYERVVDTRTVDTHMRRLREKLGEAAHHIETIRNVGYRFIDA
jgi:two-component system phosphate regulon response regulator PhoB